MKPLTRLELLAARCQVLAPSARLDAMQFAAQLGALPGWACVGDALEQTFKFPDFHRTMAFVNALAWIAHREDHHPDLHLGYGHCRVRWQTHSAAGITINDFICAAKLSALVDDAR